MVDQWKGPSRHCLVILGLTVADPHSHLGTTRKWTAHCVSLSALLDFHGNLFGRMLTLSCKTGSIIDVPREWLGGAEENYVWLLSRHCADLLGVNQAAGRAIRTQYPGSGRHMCRSHQNKAIRSPWRHCRIAALYWQGYSNITPDTGVRKTHSWA